MCSFKVLTFELILLLWYIHKDKISTENSAPNSFGNCPIIKHFEGKYPLHCMSTIEIVLFQISLQLRSNMHFPRKRHCVYSMRFTPGTVLPTSFINGHLVLAHNPPPLGNLWISETQEKCLPNQATIDECSNRRKSTMINILPVLNSWLYLWEIRYAQRKVNFHKNYIETWQQKGIHEAGWGRWLGSDMIRYAIAAWHRELTQVVDVYTHTCRIPVTCAFQTMDNTRSHWNTCVHHFWRPPNATSIAAGF